MKYDIQLSLANEKTMTDTQSQFKNAQIILLD